MFLGRNEKGYASVECLVADEPAHAHTRPRVGAWSILTDEGGATKRAFPNQSRRDRGG